MKEEEKGEEPDWFFKQKVRDYYCSCQNGKRKQGSCVHVQVALFGATLSVKEKEKYVRKESILSTTNFQNRFPLDDAEEGEEYLGK